MLSGNAKVLEENEWRRRDLSPALMMVKSGVVFPSMFEFQQKQSLRQRLECMQFVWGVIPRNKSKDKYSKRQVRKSQ